MSRIRILLADIPRLLLDLVEAITSAQPDMIIAGDHFIVADAPDALARIDADIVIASETGEAQTAEWLSLLYEHPRLTLLLLGQTGHTARLYQLRPHRTDIGELSREGLLDAIRAAARDEVA